MALANLIRRYRFEHGEMTQQQLADFCGVSRQTINAIEGNKCSPSLEIAFKIARTFGASVEDVFFFEPEPEGEHPFKDGLTVDVIWGNDEGGRGGEDGN